MALLTIIIIAVGLAMDAFAVSIVTAAGYRQLKISHALRMAFFFGAFQAFMPLIGSLAGLSLKDHVADYDHWVAFTLLTAVGVKMIYESFKIAGAEKDLNTSNIFVLLVLSVATSIDALAVGITLPLLSVPLAAAVIIIGMVTFALSWLGALLGKKFGYLFESRIEAAGGLVLIALGIKILLQHLLF
ncbi:MAG: manganese efflux pump MntP [Planctomycetota bacterium]|jgi:putative Mn2+ efflux pump MntP